MHCVCLLMSWLNINLRLNVDSAGFGNLYLANLTCLIKTETRTLFYINSTDYNDLNIYYQHLIMLDIIIAGERWRLSKYNLVFRKINEFVKTCTKYYRILCTQWLRSYVLYSLGYKSNKHHILN